MNRSVVLEVCAETLEACLAAGPGGAQRIELCCDLAVGGLTPPPALVRAAVQQAEVPVHVLLRPTAEHFGYTAGIMEQLLASMKVARQQGAAGFVLGLLQPGGEVDVEHTRTLVEEASPLPVTFHRAFDATPDLLAALEAVIATGCSRLLTSGGAPDVVAGAPMLRSLVERAGDRIAVAAGGGLTARNAQSVAEATGWRHFHASLRTSDTDKPFPQRVEALAGALARASAAPMPEAGAR